MTKKKDITLAIIWDSATEPPMEAQGRIRDAIMSALEAEDCHIQGGRVVVWLHYAPRYPTLFDFKKIQHWPLTKDWRNK